MVLRRLYILVSHVVMSYLSRYIFYGDKHVIKHLNKNRDAVIVGLQPGTLWFVLWFHFELYYLVLQFFYECELRHCSSLYFKPVHQRFHRYSLRQKEIHK